MYYMLCGCWGYKDKLVWKVDGQKSSLNTLLRLDKYFLRYTYCDFPNTLLILKSSIVNDGAPKTAKLNHVVTFTLKRN